MIKALLIAPIRFYRFFLSPWVGHNWALHHDRGTIDIH